MSESENFENNGAVTAPPVSGGEAVEKGKKGKKKKEKKEKKKKRKQKKKEDDGSDDDCLGRAVSALFRMLFSKYVLAVVAVAALGVGLNALRAPTMLRIHAMRLRSPAFAKLTAPLFEFDPRQVKDNFAYAERSKRAWDEVMLFASPKPEPVNLRRGLTGVNFRLDVEQVDVLSNAAAPLWVPSDWRMVVERRRQGLGIHFPGGGWVKHVPRPDSPASLIPRWFDDFVGDGHAWSFMDFPYWTAPHYSLSEIQTMCNATLGWVRDSYERYYVDRQQVVLMGESAGAHLALRTAIDGILYEDEYERVLAKGNFTRYPPSPQPVAHLILSSPFLEWSPDDDSMQRYGSGYGLTVPALRWYLEQLTGSSSERDWRRPEVSPALTSDDVLRRLPPTTIIVMELDPLRDAGVRFARKLEALGVAVDLHEIEGAMHVASLFEDDNMRQILVPVLERVEQRREKERASQASSQSDDDDEYHHHHQHHHHDG